MKSSKEIKVVVNYWYFKLIPYKNMKKQTNHIKDIQNKYYRRKNKSNILAKINWLFPRLIINKSNKNNYVMIIDNNGNVLLNLNDKNFFWNKTQKALELWKKVAEWLISKQIQRVIFDRNWHLYHGRVKSIADWAREWWLII